MRLWLVLLGTTSTLFPLIALLHFRQLEVVGICCRYMAPFIIELDYNCCGSFFQVACWSRLLLIPFSAAGEIAIRSNCI